MADNYEHLLPTRTSVDYIRGLKEVAPGEYESVKIARSLVTTGASEADVNALADLVDTYDGRIDALSSSVDGLHGTQIVGRSSNPSATSTASSGPNATFLWLDPVSKSGTLAQLKISARASGTLVIARYSLSAGVYTLQHSASVAIASSGLKTLSASDYGAFSVTAGDFLALYGVGIIGYTASTLSDGLGWTGLPNGAPSSATATDPANQNARLEAQFTIDWVVSADGVLATDAALATAQAGVDANSRAVALLGGTGEQLIGRPSTVTLVTGSAATPNNFVAFDPVLRASQIASMELYATTTGTIYISKWTYDSGLGIFTRTGIVSAAVSATGHVVLTAGVDFPVLELASGEYLAFYSSPALVAYTTAGGISAQDSDYYFIGGNSSTLSAPAGTVRTGYQFQLRYNIVDQVVTTATFRAATDRIASLETQGNNLAAADPVPLTTGDVPVLFGSAGWQHVISDGQSLSAGHNSQPALSTSQPYYNLTFGSGVRSGKAGNGYGAVNTSPGVSTAKALVEEDSSVGSPAADGATAEGETVLSGMTSRCNELAAVEDGIDPSELIFFASAAGHGGYSITSLNKGSAWYGLLIDQVTAAKALATAASKSFAVPAVVWMQGEKDAADAMGYATYKGHLKQLQIDISTDILAITGQSAPVHLLIYQTASANNGSASDLAPIQKAQVDAVRENSRIHFLGPVHYLTPTVDQLHLTNVSELRYGRIAGRALKQLLIDGQKPDCVWPISRTAVDTTLTLRFRVPKPPLVLDVANFGAITDGGIKVTDSTGTLSLSNIHVGADGVSLVMTLNRTLASTPVIRHGLDYKSASNGFKNSVNGILRDSTADTTVISGTTYPLWHVAPSFELPISVLAT